MTKVSILGSGNVAWHLVQRCIKSGIMVDNVWGRNIQDAQAFEALGSIRFIGDLKELNQHSDIYIICVNDDGIEQVASTIPFALSENQILIHTSGAKPSHILAPFTANFGSLWPIQTLKKLIPIVSNVMPIMYNGSNAVVTNSLLELVSNLTTEYAFISDDKKQKMHLTAVMLNNFSNHLYALMMDYCSVNQLDFHHFNAIIKETALKIDLYNPSDSQTGPAKRNDSLTIAKHISELNDEPELQKMYVLFTESIIKKYHKI